MALKSVPVVRQPSFNSSPVACRARALPSKHGDMRANTRTVQNKKKLSLLLPFGWRAKFEGKEKKVHRPPLGCHTAAQACVHLRRTRRSLLPHGTARPFYLQMVLLGRNVTFDSVPLTERASGPVRCGAVCDRAFLASPGPRTNEHMIVCTAKGIGLTRF